MKKIEFTISGITCMGCVSTLTKALYSKTGINKVNIDKDSGSTAIEGDAIPSMAELESVVNEAGNYAIDATNNDVKESTIWSKYKPLLIVVFYLFGITLLIEFSSGMFMIETWMPNFMAGFFLAFSFFKFLDLQGFASAFKTYDILAKKVPAYGYFFPFIELGLGIGYLLFSDSMVTHGITAIITFVSIVGVTRAVLSKTEIRCACLGTVFNLPMSSVTIIENAVMLVMAIVMIIMN